MNEINEEIWLVFICILFLSIIDFHRVHRERILTLYKRKNYKHTHTLKLRVFNVKYMFVVY